MESQYFWYLWPSFGQWIRARAPFESSWRRYIAHLSHPHTSAIAMHCVLSAPWHVCNNDPRPNNVGFPLVNGWLHLVFVLLIPPASHFNHIGGRFDFSPWQLICTFKAKVEFWDQLIMKSEMKTFYVVPQLSMFRGSRIILEHSNKNMIYKKA